jgi:hypothetical protein
VLLLFVLASTGAWAGTVLVGSLDLLPTNPGVTDSLTLTNLTGAGAPYTDQGLTLTDIQLTVNNTVQSFSDLPSLSSESSDTPYSSITSLDLTGTLNDSATPLLVTVNGQKEEIGPTFSIVSYSGSALDTAGACTATGSGCPHYDVFANATAVPEPAELALLGTSVSLLWIRRRKATA